MEKKLNIDNILKIALIAYFIISPIFDLAFLYNHITTLARVIILLFFVCVTVLKNKDSRKNLKYLIFYYLVVIVYLIIDYFHSKGFISLIPGDLNYSFKSEIATIIKLTMPFTVLFIMKDQNFSKKDFLKVINGWAILVGGSIVVCNLCGCSLSTYTGEITSYSIFSWNKNLPVELTATKGFFMYANQTAIVLLLALIFTSYETLFEDKKYAILAVVVALSLIMLGTRISTLGGLLTLCFIGISYVIYSYIFKKSITKRFLLVGIIVLGWISLLPISPNSDRVEVLEKNISTNENHTDEDLSQNLDDYEYFLANFNHVVFNDAFYKSYYPYRYDPDFWLNIINLDNPPSNYRTMEISIVKRIWEIDGRWTNYLFGLSNSRIQNAVNIEMDFVLHFFAFGLVGSAILLFYYLYSIIIVISRVFKTRDFWDYTVLVCLGIVVVAAFLSGNSLNFLAVNIPLSFVCSSISRKS